MNGLRCIPCERQNVDREAEYFVWVEDWPIYHYLCKEHLIEALRTGLPKIQVGDPNGDLMGVIAQVVQIDRIKSTQNMKLPGQRFAVMERALENYADHRSWNKDSRCPHDWVWEGSRGDPWIIAAEALDREKELDYQFRAKSGK